MDARDAIFLVIVIYFGNLINVKAEIVATHFQMDATYNGTSCSDENDVSDPVISKIHCANQCSVKQGCKGFFYNTFTGKCSTVKNVPNSPNECQAEQGSVYYKKATTTTTTTAPPTVYETSTTTTTTTPTTTTTTAPPALYGMSCLEDVDCSQLAHTGCHSKTCQCTGGYKVEPSTSTCVSSCDVYGTSYLVFVGLAMYMPNMPAELNFNDHTAAECQSRCNSEPSCRSYNFFTDGGGCYLKPTTSLESSVSLSTNPSCTHYVRNCN